MDTTTTNPAPTEPVAARQPQPVPRTKNQIKAGSLIDGIAAKAKWKILIADARAVWPKLPHEELVQVDGNFHRLAGLVQMRQQVSREEADQQVKAFLARHDVAG
ncbi:MAG: hypothetical protein M0Q15_03650 [Nevskia sp.]|jgi:hypothetical protein|nr:hypothetical protein [Nevskia sp.]